MADTNANTQNADQNAGTTTTGQNATVADNQPQNSGVNIDYDKIQSMIDKGQISEEAVKSALQKVKDDCPQLFATDTTKTSQGFKVGADNSNTNSDADNNELRKMFGLK